MAPKVETTRDQDLKAVQVAAVKVQLVERTFIRNHLACSALQQKRTINFFMPLNMESFIKGKCTFWGLLPWVCRSKALHALWYQNPWKIYKATMRSFVLCLQEHVQGALPDLLHRADQLIERSEASQVGSLPNESPVHQRGSCLLAPCLASASNSHLGQPNS